MLKPSGNVMFETTEELFAWLESFANFEKKPAKNKREFRLDRMLKLSALCGNPGESYKIIHVAGSKGKGSTSAYLAHILDKEGFRTGLYTSPHIENWTERIRICGEETDSEVLLSLGQKVRDLTGSEDLAIKLPGGKPTTFELLTLLALLYFREKGCDWVVLETGLGGRLDATNIVTPAASVITSLELEHTEILGDTLPLIAAEKGGIIKLGVPLFVARQENGSLEVLRELAFGKKTHLQYLPDFISLTEGKVNLKGQSHSLVFRYTGKRMDFQLRMPGSRQGDNAALAVLTIKSLFPEMKDSVIKAGLAKASLPGRMEILSESPFILLDSAHTRESVRSAALIMKAIPQKGSKVLIFGCLKDKDAAGMAAVLAGTFQNILVTTPGTYRESDPEEVFNIFFKRFPGTLLVPDPLKALETARSLAGRNGVILITGSFYLAGVIKLGLSAVQTGLKSEL
jgi:dihydrofolate synthase/folylpolyglutamate synthase